MRSPIAWFRDVFAAVRRGPDPVAASRFVMPYSVVGLNLGPDEILSLGAVWACIDAIARGIGQCDWNVYKPVGHLRRELLVDDPLMWILNTRPNPEMTAIGFREALLFQAVPQGNAYAEIVRDLGGRVSQLWPLLTERMQPKRRRDTWELYYEYRDETGQRIEYEPREILHIRGPGLSGLMGDNLIARAAKSMGVAAAQERYSGAFFGQGASPSIALEYPGVLDDKQMRRLKEDWAEKRKGPENAHKPMFLESGMKVQQLGVDPEKSQMVESRQFSVEEIARWFGVPLHKIQHLVHATFSNIEHQSIEFVRDAINPWKKRCEQEADVKLLRQDRGPFRRTEFDTSPLLVGDLKSRADAYAILRQNGIATANECRAREGLNHAGPEGDVLLVQSNLTTMKKLLAAPAPGTAPPGAPPKPGTKPPPGTDDGEPATDDGEADNYARQALVALIGGIVGRYVRRMENRRADLERRPRSGHDDKEQLITALMVKERERLLPKLLEELATAQPFAARALGRELGQEDLLLVVARAEQGELPATAAAKLLPSTTEETT
jgi:HK97 family phage portal protein